MYEKIHSIAGQTHPMTHFDWRYVAATYSPGFNKLTKSPFVMVRVEMCEKKNIIC